jgi:hypothetical protein
MKLVLRANQNRVGQPWLPGKFVPRFKNIFRRNGVGLGHLLALERARLSDGDDLRQIGVLGGVGGVGGAALAGANDCEGDWFVHDKMINEF